MADFNKPLDILNYPRLSLFTPAPGVDKERATLEWGTLNGMPRCTLWTRSDDKERGPIFASIGHEALAAFYRESLRIFSSGEVETLGFDYMRPAGEGSYEKVVHSTINIGRGDDGICFIGLKSADEARPKIIFSFRGFDWHPMRRKNKPFTQEEISTAHALGWLECFRVCLLSHIKGQTPEERKELAERRKAAREGRGGGNRSGQQSYQSHKPKQSFTDSGGFGDEYSL